MMESKHPLVAMGMMTEEAYAVSERQARMFDRYMASVERERSRQIDELLRVSIQPKPKYIPEWLWKKLIARIVRLEMIGSVTHGD